MCGRDLHYQAIAAIRLGDLDVGDLFQLNRTTFFLVAVASLLRVLLARSASIGPLAQPGIRSNVFETPCSAAAGLLSQNLRSKPHGR